MLRAAKKLDAAVDFSAAGADWIDLRPYHTWYTVVVGPIGFISSCDWYHTWYQVQ